MKREMSSLDLFFLRRELKFLEGGRIEKIYQNGKSLQMKIFISGKGAFDLYFEPGKIFITEYKRKFPEPPGFCMLLRKHLLGQRIVEIRQYDFERIVELETENNILIFELFSKGNVILCDKLRNVIMPMEIQIWKDRQILPRKPYNYPPSVTNPFALDFYELKKKILESEKMLVIFLAVDLSLSGKYAEEVCARAGVEKNKFCKKLSDEEIKKIYESLHSLLKEFNPQLILDNGKSDFAPFNMVIYSEKKRKTAKTFTRILDEFFTEDETARKQKEIEEKFEAELKRLERIKQEQGEAIKKLRKKEKEQRKKAELIYNNFDLVESIISGLKRARDSGLDWKEIKKRIEIEDTPETRAIKEIKEGEGIVVLQLNSYDIEIDFTRTPQENAEEYFGSAKKAKEKLESAKKERKKLLYKIRKLKKTKEISIEEKTEKPKRKRRGKWYEKFRWFLTTDGFLVIAGRDATQNEIIFKKYLDKDDIVLHADIHGAPLTVIKSEGKEITPLAIREAGEFAAAYSSAWKRKIGVDVYWIRPEQISKTPPSGEYLPKGAFMIRGEKNYLKKMELKIAIGIKFEVDKKTGEIFAKPICGNVQSVRNHAKYFVTVFPGDLSQSEVAKLVKLKILQKTMPEDKKLIENVELEEIQRLLPPGEGSVVG